MQHVARTPRPFPWTYHPRHPVIHVTGGFGGHPLAGGTVRIDIFKGPQGPQGQPYTGMDPTNPVTWVRPWNPAPGMIGYLNFDGARQAADIPAGGVSRRRFRDRKVKVRD